MQTAIDKDTVTAMVAYFLSRARARGESQLSKLKLIKLLYLAERQFILDTGESMTDDDLVNMPKGPALSKTLNLLNLLEKQKPTSAKPRKQKSNTDWNWSYYFEFVPEYNFQIRPQVSDSNIRELYFYGFSDLDAEVLKKTWAKFGDWTQNRLIAYTHKLPEWEDPQGSSKPIDYKTILLGSGKYGKREANQIAKGISEQKIISAFMRT